MVAPSIGIGVLEREESAIAALESQIQVLPRPQDADLGFASGIGILPLPVRSKRNGHGAFPILHPMRSVESEFVIKIRSHDFRRSRNRIAVVLHQHSCELGTGNWELT